MKNKIAFSVMRISIGLVFLLFGIGKLNNDIWADTIRSMDFFTRLPWNVDLSVMIIGISEIATGAALVAGLCTRFFSWLAAAQLLGILMLMKFDEIRDIGLLGAALYMAIAGNEGYGLPLARIGGKKS